jgi:hypothetical protein
MNWVLLPLASFLGMFAQDILCVIMVQAEASYRARRAAWMDTAQDACGVMSLLAVGGAVFIGHDVPLSAAVLGARLLADYCGTYSGVRLGQRLDGRKPR